MKLVAGLGNPGPQYAESRHNIGFLVADELARRWQVDLTGYDRRFEGQLGEAQRGEQRVVLLKPATYMNLSGRSVGAVWRFYKMTLADVLVVIDDLDLPVGALRLRADGSAGGQKGLADVLLALGSPQVARLRIGIGRVHRTATVGHVLGKFAPDERPEVDAAIKRAADAAECWLSRGIAAAMNEFNRRGADPAES